MSDTSDELRDEPGVSNALPSPGEQKRDDWRVDLALACLAALATAMLTLWLSSSVPLVLTEEKYFDAYFGADFPRAFQDLTSRWTRHGGSSKHPIFCLLSIPTYGLRFVFGLSTWQAVKAMLAINSFVLIATMYYLCKHITGRKLDSLLLSALLASSAASIFWLPVPETYGFATTTALLPLLLFLNPHLSRSYLAHVVAILLSVSVTLTNVSSGLVAAWLQLGMKKSVYAAFHAAGFLYLIMCFQTVAIPSSGFISASEILFWADASKSRQSVANTTKHFFLMPISVDQVSLYSKPAGETKGIVRPHTWPQVYTGKGEKAIGHLLAQAPILQIAQYVIWIILLVGSFAIFSFQKEKNILLNATYLILAAHLLILFKFGNEQFLYSLHWTPLMCLTIGTSLRSRFRVISLTLIIFLVCANLWTNLQMYMATMDLLQSFIHSPPPTI